MNIFEYLDKNPFFSIAIIGMILHTIEVIIKYAYYMWLKMLRHINICRHGYPPKHCDADGDIKKPIIKIIKNKKEGENKQ